MTGDPRPLPPDDQPAPIRIADPAELAARCRAWRRQPAIGIDTEFVRTRTFFAGLGLVQVADGDGNHLIDVLAIDDLTPLADLLADPGVVKVFHACGEDLEVLYHRFGALPSPIVDTQIAAALTGHGYSLGYRRLVADLFAIDLPKDETRTDWLRRPLAPQQERYAALDVAYLLPAHRRLDTLLVRRGREAWLQEEIERLADVDRFLPAPDTVYRRLKGRGRLTPRQLAVLRGLAAWREETARRRDLPRSFVVRDAALLDLARARPRSQQALAATGALAPAALRRHGAALVRTIREHDDLPAASWPKPPAHTDLAPHRGTLRRLQSRVAERAAELDLPPELLAPKRLLELLLRRWIRGAEPLLPAELRGWRGALLEDLVAALAAT